MARSAHIRDSPKCVCVCVCVVWVCVWCVWCVCVCVWINLYCSRLHISTQSNMEMYRKNINILKTAPPLWLAGRSQLVEWLFRGRRALSLLHRGFSSEDEAVGICSWIRTFVYFLFWVNWLEPYFRLCMILSALAQEHLTLNLLCWSFLYHARNEFCSAVAEPSLANCKPQNDFSSTYAMMNAGTTWWWKCVQL